MVASSGKYVAPGGSIARPDAPRARPTRASAAATLRGCRKNRTFRNTFETRLVSDTFGPKGKKTTLKRRQRQCGHHGRIHGARQGGPAKKAGQSASRASVRPAARKPRRGAGFVSARAVLPPEGRLPASRSTVANIFRRICPGQKDRQPRVAGASGFNGMGKPYMASRYSRAMSSGPTSRGLLAGLPLASASRAMIPH